MEIIAERKLLHEQDKAILKIGTIIIGASAAGLACAASLSKKKLPYLILEKNDHLAGPWRSHYDRLHLNTEKWSSHLPYMPFPETSSQFLSKEEVINYMEDYAARFDIRPLFNELVIDVAHSDMGWKVKTANNEWLAAQVIIATGFNRRPVIPTWPGMQHFEGAIIHSSLYKNGAVYKGKKVLVVGFGSSACEIAICLHEYGAFVSMSVKGGVNVIPRDLGNPWLSRIIHKLAFFSRIFPELVDQFVAGPLNKRYGFLKEYGLTKLPYGPNVQMIRHKKVPVLDVGTMDLIRNGTIRIYPGIERFLPGSIQFTDGREEPFDSVILATGYQPHLRDFFPQAPDIINNDNSLESRFQGLFFCGFTVSPYGMLNQIGKDARKIARLISKRKPL